MIIKCNFLLKNNTELKPTKDINTSKINYIKKYKELPHLDKTICFDDEINFLNNLEKEINSLEHNNEIFQNSFHFSNLEKNLIDIVKKILYEDNDSNISKDNNNFEFDFDDIEDIFIQEE